jgi:hypothetical protein
VIVNASNGEAGRAIVACLYMGGTAVERRRGWVTIHTRAGERRVGWQAGNLLAHRGLVHRSAAGLTLTPAGIAYAESRRMRRAGWLVLAVNRPVTSKGTTE